MIPQTVFSRRGSGGIGTGPVVRWNKELFGVLRVGHFLSRVDFYITLLDRAMRGPQKTVYCFVQVSLDL